jgi:hypothetical protein
MTKPLTQKFKDLYALGSMWPKWLRFLWLGLVVWLEGKYLDVIIEQQVLEAISDWHTDEGQLNPVTTWKDVKAEVLSSDVPGLPTLRISAPWVDREVGYDRE